jgi:hypothetical protein
MNTLVHIMIPVLVLSVAVVLLLGLINLVRLGPSNLSQRLMRWRVGLQLIAVLLIMASFYLTRG